jgi:hypothetical protein
MKLEYYGKIFAKYSNIIFHENPTRGSRDAPCTWTDMKRQIIAIRNFVDASKKCLNNTESQDLSSGR